MTAASASKSKLSVRQVKSGIGFDKTQKATLRALGLGRIGKSRQVPDNPEIRGMIRKVTHLVVIDDMPDN
jgi:large subunit ribosomal protein L30